MAEASTNRGARVNLAHHSVRHTHPVSELVLESTFAGCRIQGVAGRGGMGVVYRATQLPLGRTVALKVVAPERAADPIFHSRFERETRVAAAIDHPNVIPVYEAGEQDGRLYLVMRWVEGGDLQQLIGRSGRLDPALAARIVAQVGSGLEAAHAAGLVHRDVKPANVLLAGDEAGRHVYLTDFGLTLDAASDTRLTQTGDLLGTVEFMAPEQLEARPVDARTDVYALGCVLHAALTGRAAVLARHLRRHDARPPERAAAAAVRHAGGAERIRRRGGAGARQAPRGPLRVGSRAGGRRARGGRSGGRDAPAGRSSRPAGAQRRRGLPTVALPATTARLPADATRPTGTCPRPRPGSAARAGPPPVGARCRGRGPGRGRPRRFCSLLDAGPFESEAASGPLSATEVREVADSFAAAYAREDDGALRDLLSRDVSRVTPADSQRGRAAVLREYRGQFASNVTQDYRITGLAVRGGAAGRATGRYVATRSGDAPITGRIALGVGRDGGRARVGLIAVTPDG